MCLGQGKGRLGRQKGCGGGFGWTYVTDNNGVVVVESVVERERLQFAIVFTVIEVARVSLNELVETVSAKLVCVCAKQQQQ